jgi:hypothetical protein
MTTKLNTQQLLDKLADLSSSIQERFPDVDVEYYRGPELWGPDHARLEQRGFPWWSSQSDAVVLIRAGDANREKAAEMAHNLADILREQTDAIVQVIATSEVWCKESQPMRVETFVPGRALKRSFFKTSHDDRRGLTFLCVSNDDPDHAHTWDRLKPAGSLH